MAVIKCSICRKPVAQRRQSFEKRMTLLREHRKKYHRKEFMKSVKKGVKVRMQRQRKSDNHA